MEMMMTPMQRFPTPPPLSPEPPDEDILPVPQQPQPVQRRYVVQHPPRVEPKRDLVKWAVLIAILAIVIGFFIGKSMNPVHIHLSN